MFNPCSSSLVFDKSLCTCTDGSTPTSTRVKAVCSDNSRQDCSGSRPDGSDPSKLPKFLMKLSRSTPCPGDTYPVIASCTCEDGTAALEGEARRKSKCEDGTFPTCPGESRLSKCSYVDHELLGACDDGSDATLDDDKSTEPCEDGSRPNKSVCVYPKICVT